MHRLEVLLVGGIMLIAGLIVAVLMYVRPPAQLISSPAAGEPVAVATPAVATAMPSAAPRVATAPAAPSAPGRPSARASSLSAAWPFLLLVVGVVGLGLAGGRIARRRRMAYTGQSVGMLLEAADATTREANLRVMRDLHAQGQLPNELAAAAGLARAKRRLTPPKLALPKLALPKLALPKLALPRRLARPVPTLVVTAPPLFRLDVAPEAPVVAEAPASTSAAPTPAAEVPPPAPQDVLHLVPVQSTTAPDAQLGTAVADDSAQEVTLPEVATPTAVPGAPDAGWSAEDRALAAAAALGDVWRTEHLTSPVLALDTVLVGGSAQVVVTVDAVPDEDARLTGLPDRLVALQPTWRARWRPAQQQTAMLTIDVSTAGALPQAGGPLIAPVLHHGRGNRVARYFPLDTWRHLGLYGGEALGALHTLLTGILYTQPPSAVACAVLDQGQISPLYRGVAHQVVAPGDVRATCEALARALRREVGGRVDVRPLLLVVVEPDAEALAALATLLARLREQPGVPVHLLLAQECLSPAGRDLYAMLPALITRGGQGAVSWLPGQQSEWPKHATARLVGRGMRLEGRPATLDEAQVAELVAPLRWVAAQLPPVVWDVSAAPAVAPPLPSPSEPVPLSDPELHEPTVADAPIAVPVIEAALPEPVPEATDDGVERAASRPDVRTPDAPEEQQQEQVIPGSTPVSPPTVAFREGDLPGGGDEEVDALEGTLARMQAARERPRASMVVAVGTARGAAVSSMPPPPEPDNGWPSGPSPLSRAALATLIEQLVVDPDILTAKQPDQIGVTKKRLQALGQRLGLFPENEAKALSETLLVWFDHAAILVMPLKSKEHPLNQPRALDRADVEWIRERLTATPVPVPEAVRAAFAAPQGAARP